MMEQENEGHAESHAQPKDRYYIIYFIAMLQGITILLPWNTLIIAKPYFVDYKLGKNYTQEETALYRTQFLPYVGVAIQLPSVIFSWINIFITIRGSISIRIYVSLVVEITLFILIITFIFIDTSKWSITFFWITIGKVVILSIANTIYQSTVVGAIAVLPGAYTSSMVTGHNVCGVFVSLWNIMLNFLISSLKLQTIIHFTVASLILLCGLYSYYYLRKLEFYEHYYALTEASSIEDSSTESTPYLKILKQCSIQCFNVFYTLFITCAIFPAVYSDVKRSSESFPISQEAFTNVTCFLTLNFFSMIGNAVSIFINAPGPDKLITYVLARTIFIPLFLFANYNPVNIRRTLPVLINNDWVYWIMGILFSFTGGYFYALSLMFCGKVVESRYSMKGGMFGIAFLVTGICIGVGFSGIFPWLVGVTIH